MSATDASVVSWLEVTDQRIRTLMSSANDASRQRPTSREQAAASVDGFRSAVQSLQRWTVQHPCPDPALGARFELLLARYGFIALLTGDDVSEPNGAALPTAFDRLRVLNADLKALLDDVEEYPGGAASR